MRLADEAVTIEETERWQKITMPADRNLWLLALYSILMAVWIAMFGIIAVALVRPFGVAEIRTLFVVVWRILLVAWLVVWIWFARRWLWRYWQYLAASREILFINREELVIRRPVSLLGITDTYDMAHVTPFRYDMDQPALVFDYGTRPVYFGRGLDEGAALELSASLNRRYFPENASDA